MFFDFLKSASAINKLQLSIPQKLDAVIKLENAISIIITGLIGTIIVNYFIFRISKHWFEKINENSIDLEKTTFTTKEITSVFSFFLVSTLIIYHKVIKYFSSHLFAIGGDSFNHYARLKASKDILLNPDKSIFHWPGIFFPDGLTAFDGPPTLYNDLVHLAFSPILSSIQIYNLIHLSTFILGGLFAYILIKEITKDSKIGIFCGFIFVFGQQHIHAAHLWLNITHIEYIPLVVFFYLRLIKETKSRIKYHLCTAFILTIIGYQSLYFYFMLSMFLTFIGISIYKKNIFQQKTLSLPLILSSLLMLPWLLPMLRDPTVEKGSYTPHIFFNTDLLNTILPRGPSLFLNSFEINNIYIGLLMSGLIIFGLFKVKNQPLTKLILFLLLVFSCGSFLRAGRQIYPIALPEIILTFLPAFKSLRSTDRYLLFLPLVSGIILMKFFLQTFKTKKHQVFLYPLIILTIISYSSFPSKTIDPKAPEIYHYIPTTPNDNEGVLEFPINSPIYWLWRADHGHPIVYGYIFIRGKKNKFFHHLHEKIMKREKIEIKELKDKGVKYIVSHQNEEERLYAKNYGHPEREDDIYSHISDYIKASDLIGIREIRKIGNRVLYEIK